VSTPSTPAGSEPEPLRVLVLVPVLESAEEASRIYLQMVRHRPTSLELVYLPFVLFRYRIAATSLFGRKREETGAVLVDLNGSVPINIRKGTRITGPGMERYAGAIEAEGRGRQRSAGPPFSVESRRVPARAVAPANIPVEEAVKDGLRILRYEYFRLIGPLRNRRMEIRAEDPHTLLYHPYWIFYYLGRGGGKAYDVLDALNGSKEGGQITRSVARALFGAPDPRPAARA